MPNSRYTPEIQVQKPAPSLQNFQKTLGQPDRTQLFRYALWCGVLSLVLLLSKAGFDYFADQRVVRFLVTFEQIRSESEGNLSNLNKGEALRSSIEKGIPRLQALLKTTPSAYQNQVFGMLKKWELILGTSPSTNPSLKLAPWETLQLAEQALAVGQTQQAQDLIQPLGSKAKLQASWGMTYWELQLSIDQQKGSFRDAQDHLALFEKSYPKADASALRKIVATLTPQ